MARLSDDHVLALGNFAKQSWALRNSDPDLDGQTIETLANDAAKDTSLSVQNDRKQWELLQTIKTRLKEDNSFRDYYGIETEADGSPNIIQFNNVVNPILSKLYEGNYLNGVANITEGLNQVFEMLQRQSISPGETYASIEDIREHKRKVLEQEKKNSATLGPLTFENQVLDKTEAYKTGEQATGYSQPGIPDITQFPEGEIKINWKNFYAFKPKSLDATEKGADELVRLQMLYDDVVSNPETAGQHPTLIVDRMKADLVGTPYAFDEIAIRNAFGGDAATINAFISSPEGQTVMSNLLAADKDIAEAEIVGGYALEKAKRDKQAAMDSISGMLRTIADQHMLIFEATYADIAGKVETVPEVTKKITEGINTAIDSDDLSPINYKEDTEIQDKVVKPIIEAYNTNGANSILEGGNEPLIFTKKLEDFSLADGSIILSQPARVHRLLRFVNSDGKAVWSLVDENGIIQEIRDSNNNSIDPDAGTYSRRAINESSNLKRELMEIAKIHLSIAGLHRNSEEAKQYGGRELIYLNPTYLNSKVDNLSLGEVRNPEGEIGIIRYRENKYVSPYPIQQEFTGA